MTPYLIRLIRRAQGDAPAMMPVKSPEAGHVDDFLEHEEEIVSISQRSAAQSKLASLPVLQTEKSPVFEGGKRDVTTIKHEQPLKDLKHFEYGPHQLEPLEDQTAPEFKKENPSIPARNIFSDHRSIENNKIPGDPARSDSDERIKVLPDNIQNNSIKTIYQTRNETNITNVEVHDEARSHSHVAIDPAPHPPPAFRIENEPEPPLLSKTHPVLKPTIESISQPVWPLHPRRQPDPRQGSHQRQDNGTTVEIGSVIIETVKTPATPKRPAVRPYGQRRKRPGPMRSEPRDNRRHQKSVSRLKYGLGAL